LLGNLTGGPFCIFLETFPFSGGEIGVQYSSLLIVQGYLPAAGGRLATSTIT
jgi:hypothetical protein